MCSAWANVKTSRRPPSFARRRSSHGAFPRYTCLAAGVADAAGLPSVQLFLILTAALSTVLASCSADVSSSNDVVTERTRRMPLVSVEHELDAARAAIQRAARRRRRVDPAGRGSGNVTTADTWFDPEVDHALVASVYRNPAAFHQSYREMEKGFKVYVYEEGEPPILHAGPCKDIYTIEGRFIEQLELMAPPASLQGGRRGGGARRSVRTSDPARAHAFFLPFSVSKMVQFAYRPNSYDKTPLRAIVGDYVRVVASRHPYWYRSAGADHFMLSCHDWGPEASRGHPELHANSIRALCNANTSEGFRPGQDVSVPEINLYTGDMPRQLLAPAPPLASRPFLAFFAGGRHGHARDLLLRHWKGRDPDVFPVYEHSHGQQNGGPPLDYYSFMRCARFCLCQSGYEMASPRVVEAIHAECVPVILSDGYALPFADVLLWEAFSVAVPVADIARLREVLERIPAGAGGGEASARGAPGQAPLHAAPATTKAGHV